MSTDKMLAGRKASLLAKPVIFQGRRMLKSEMVKALVQQGGTLRTDHFQKHMFNRTAFNRMDARKQAAYEKKLQLKMPFAIQLPSGSVFEITATEAEHFIMLGGHPMRRAPTCECCHGHAVGDGVECCPGFLHMDDSCGRGPGIERCDECAIYDDDEAAQAAHDSQCSCGLTVATHEPSDADSDFSLHFS